MTDGSRKDSRQILKLTNTWPKAEVWKMVICLPKWFVSHNRGSKQIEHLRMSKKISSYNLLQYMDLICNEAITFVIQFFYRKWLRVTHVANVDESANDFQIPVCVVRSNNFQRLLRSVSINWWRFRCLMWKIQLSTLQSNKKSYCSLFLKTLLGHNPLPNRRFTT